LGHLDKEQEFEVRATSWDVRDLMPSIQFAALGSDMTHVKSVWLPDDRQHHLQR
jgi:hypothetical protein